MTNISVFFSHKHKIAYVAILKVGSRTMYRLMFAIAGVPETEDKPWGQHLIERENELKEYGLERKTLSINQVLQFKKQNPDYVWLAVTRHPYERALSTYSDKVNRIVRYTNRKLYISAKLRTFGHHPKNWWSTKLSRQYMKKNYSFEDFLSALLEKGTKTDTHFKSQVESLGGGAIEFDIIGDIDLLAKSLDALQEKTKFNDFSLADFARNTQANRTGSGTQNSHLLTPAAKQKIQEIYPDDFSLLGYSVDY